METGGLYESIFEHCSEAMVMLRPDGTLFRMNRAARELPGVDVAALLYGSSEELDRFRARLGRRERASVELRVTATDGAPRCLALEGRSEGVHGVVVIRDVTDKAQLEEEVRHLRRVESVGYLTASLAHDFNNLLSVISCSSAVLAAQVQDRERLLELAEEIRLATDRAASMVRQLLSQVRRKPSTPTPTSLNGVVSGIRPLIERLVGDGVNVAFRLDPEVAQTVIDRDVFEHALLNLAANARDAMPGGGRLTIATRNVALADEEDAEAVAATGRFVALLVSDTGVGMSREVRERVFDRFFTTKDTRGTGLGLAMVHRFATQSGGCVAVHSTPGQGTTVVVYLPRASVPPPPPSAASLT